MSMFLPATQPIATQNPGTPQTPPPPTRDQVRDQLRTQIRDAVRGAIRGQAGQQDFSKMAKDIQTAVAQVEAQAPVANPALIATLQAQIAAEQANLFKLTNSLTPGLSDAREQAITQQIDDAGEHLKSLQAQLDRALGKTEDVPMSMFPPGIPTEIPSQVMEITKGFFITCAVIAIGIPLARAFGRWMDRRGAPPAAMVADTGPRLERIEQAIEAVAIEVERVSEGQRYTNKVMTELRALPAPNVIEQWAAQARKEALPVEGKT